MNMEKFYKLGRHAILICMILALTLSGCVKKGESEKTAGDAGQTSPQEPTAPGAEAAPGEAPHIEFESTTFDFGKVDQGEEVTHAFKFRNTGGRELTIDKVQSSCGCAAALASSEKIGPGEEGSIEATFRTKGYQGRTTKTIRVHTNNPEVSTVTLRITGDILTDVMVWPRSLNFGNMRRDTTTDKELEVTFSSDEEIEIKKAEFTSGHFTSTVKPFETEAGRGAKITVSTIEDLPLGRIKEKVLIHTTSTKNPTLTVPIYAYVQGDITVRPMVLSFSKAPAGGVQERTLRVATTAEAFAILGVKVNEDLFSTEVKTVEPGKVYSLKITLNDEVSEGRINEVLLIRTDSSEQPEIRVPIYGSVGGVPTGGKRMMKGQESLFVPAPQGIKPRLFKKPMGEEESDDPKEVQ